VFVFLAGLAGEMGGEPLQILVGTPEGQGAIMVGRRQFVIELTIQFREDRGGDLVFLHGSFSSHLYAQAPMGKQDRTAGESILRGNRALNR